MKFSKRIICIGIKALHLLFPRNCHATLTLEMIRCPCFVGDTLVLQPTSGMPRWNIITLVPAADSACAETAMGFVTPMPGCAAYFRDDVILVSVACADQRTLPVGPTVATVADRQAEGRTW